jgi:peptidoglycan-associated lipoprotein
MPASPRSRPRRSLPALGPLFGVALLALLGLLALGGCKDKKVKYPACGADKDCKDGEKCINKQCRQCGTDADCPDGQECQEGACVVKAECSADTDCADGQICKDGSCTACTTNGECGTGGRCEDGACVRPTKCKVDEDCQDDEDCVDGLCQQPWKTGGDTGDGSCTLPTVYFSFDDATVPEDQRDALNAAGECIGTFTSQVYVEGHTDVSGTDEYNVALSERRGQAVADFLARLGVDPARLRVIPKGEAEATGMGDEKDRRVELEKR